jgi:hypothetical protein
VHMAGREKAIADGFDHPGLVSGVWRKQRRGSGSGDKSWVGRTGKIHTASAESGCRAAVGLLDGVVGPGNRRSVVAAGEWRRPQFRAPGAVWTA